MTMSRAEVITSVKGGYSRRWGVLAEAGTVMKMPEHAPLARHHTPQMIAKRAKFLPTHADANNP
jgi:hypothetical protein